MKYYRTIAGMIAACMLLTGAAAYQPAAKDTVQITASAADEQTSGDFAYVIDKEGNLNITGYTGTDTAVVFPAELDGKPVYGIGDGSSAVLRGKS